MSERLDRIERILESFILENKELREIQAKNEKENEKHRLETKNNFDKVSEAIKETNRNISGLSDSVGSSLEYSFFVPLRETLFLDSVKYDKIYTKLKQKNNEKEFDIVLENGKTIALIEIKHTVREKLFKEKLVKLKNEYIETFQEDKNKEIKVYLGSENFHNSIIDLAYKHNIKLLTLKNDLVEVVKKSDIKEK